MLEINFLKLLEGIRTDFLNTVVSLITVLGEETVIVVMIAVIYFMFDKRLAKQICFVTAVSLSFNGIIKNLVRRPRPFASGEVTCVKPDTATGYAFPSGHTQTIATWSTALAYRFRKLSLILFAVIATVAVGFSRMYLGAHFPTDVIVGAALGIFLAIGFSVLYDRVSNKTLLCLIVAAVMLPFAIGFLFASDLHFRDFYKSYGMILGFIAGSVFEEKYVSFGYDVPLWKKLLRVVVGIGLAFAMKEGIKLLYFSDHAALIMMMDTVRYAVLVFVVMGIAPWIFKKINL